MRPLAIVAAAALWASVLAAPALGAGWDGLLAPAAGADTVKPSPPAGGPAPEKSPPGSFTSNALLMPTEVFVLTREELLRHNIHTLDDVLRLLPGVVFFREGPPDAFGGFSIDGRSHFGVNLFVNGVPAVDPYTLEAFMKFLPLSRLKQIEVVYSGSPYVTGDLSSNGAINVVIEEGGRTGPSTDVDFTYGGSNRRARRAWFATPRAHIGGVFAYDEYLQDAAQLLVADPTAKLGKADMRSILAELVIHSAEGDDVLLRLHRSEEDFIGTALASDENVRQSGFDSEIEYRRAGFSGSVRQRVLKVTRDAGRIESFTLGGAGGWAGSFGPLGVRAFVNGERSDFDNELSGVSFDPSYRRVEAAVTLGSRLPTGVTVRGGAFGGDHNRVGRYGGAELAVAKDWGGGFTQSVTLARRLRLPSAEELFQPLVPSSAEEVSDTTVGNAQLSPEVSDEISVGARVSPVTLDLFARNERSRIILVGASRHTFRAEGSASVVGARGRFEKSFAYRHFDCAVALGAEGYGRRSDFTPGIPRYRFTGKILVTHPIFRGTEIVSVGIDSEVQGRRAWPGTALAPYGVHDVSASFTIMSARVSAEYRNVFNARYETVPGFFMPGRYFVIGIFWELFD